jgi:hypothetical protein
MEERLPAAGPGDEEDALAEGGGGGGGGGAIFGNIAVAGPSFELLRQRIMRRGISDDVSAASGW